MGGGTLSRRARLARSAQRVEETGELESATAEWGRGVTADGGGRASAGATGEWRVGRTSGWSGAGSRNRSTGRKSLSIMLSVHCRGASRGAILFTFWRSPHSPACFHTRPVPGRVVPSFNYPGPQVWARGGEPSLGGGEQRAPSPSGAGVVT